MLNHTRTDIITDHWHALSGDACFGKPIQFDWLVIMPRAGELRGKILMSDGTADTKDRSAKTALAIKFNELIDKRGLSQTEVVEITCMTQPKVSQVKRYRLQNISLERLMQALVSLDQHLEIVVRPARRSHSAGLTVNLT